MVFASCEKEFSVEGVFTGLGNQGGTAVFRLDGAPSACLGAQVQGTYTKGVAMTSTNLAVLTVNVTQLGTYTISTGTINGFSFSGSGTFTVLGLQFIQLNATGTPTNSGTSIFLPGTTPCSLSVTVGAGSSGSSSGTSVYTFNGAPNACAAPVINGTYRAGTALTASNTIVLSANVTTAGTYTITTTNNGMTFTANGTFAAIGPNQSVTFVGSGTPTAAGSTNFLSGSATAGCTFAIPVTGTGTTPAGFTFAGAPGACTTPVITGVYTQGTALTAANTVTLQVNVTTIGAYTIAANAGGMSFTRTGSFTTTGTQTVTLNGSGTPTTAGPVAFTPTGGAAAGCIFTITVLPTGTAASSFTFIGAPGTCTAAVIAGTYNQGTALTASNTVTLQVNVTTLGTYSITAAAGGMTFSRSGSFTTTGPQNVILNGTGTPSGSGAVSFTPTGASAAGCSFVITVSATGPGIFLRATIAGVAYEFNRNLVRSFDAGPPALLSIDGEQSLPTGGVRILSVFLGDFTSALTTGNFTNFTGTNFNKIIEVEYSPDGGTTFFSSNMTANSLTGVLTTMTATSATGTFTGNIYLNGTGMVPIAVTNGTFSVTF